MTAHHNQHAGLLEHSVGSIYPIIRAQYGDGTHGVLYGGLELRGLSKSEATQVSEVARWYYISEGRSATVEYLKRRGAEPRKIF